MDDRLTTYVQPHYVQYCVLCTVGYSYVVKSVRTYSTYYYVGTLIFRIEKSKTEQRRKAFEKTGILTLLASQCQLPTNMKKRKTKA